MNPDPSTTGDDASATQAWAEMQEFIAGQDRRRALRLEMDLGPGKAELLIKLAQAPMTLREIAQSAEVDPSAASVAVDNLERRGFVRRGAHPDDKRRKLVHLTDSGQQAAATARRILTDPPPVLAALAAEDLTTLTRIFVTLNAKPESEPEPEPEPESEPKADH